MNKKGNKMIDLNEYGVMRIGQFEVEKVAMLQNRTGYFLMGKWHRSKIYNSIPAVIYAQYELIPDNLKSISIEAIMKNCLSWWVYDQNDMQIAAS